MEIGHIVRTFAEGNVQIENLHFRAVAFFVMKSQTTLTPWSP